MLEQMYTPQNYALTSSLTKPELYPERDKINKVLARFVALEVAAASAELQISSRINSKYSPAAVSRSFAFVVVFLFAVFFM
jgi:hypothetical protein